MTTDPKRPPSSASLSLRNSEIIQIFSKKSDSEIWSDFDNGDELAFNYLYRTYVPILYKYGMQISNEESIVQDCIQNLFLYLRGKRGSLSNVNSIKPYLIKSLKRDVIGKLSKIKKVEFKDIDEFEGSFLIEVSCESKMIESEVTYEMKRKLEKAMNRLTPKQRLAILLLYEEGLNYKEISEVFEFKDIKTARKLVYRAINNLKSLIK